ncbi:hypothetical protein E2C01_059786 [Portunus trituberculatus]|uniref:Uncharacterized protein n=1 Tax=Portunus trituberculatus TaxID=210409 RepID=A0A5B7H9F0_PORTR|nr:hypothetical protein [Portunus trituberculatus]
MWGGSAGHRYTRSRPLPVLAPTPIPRGQERGRAVAFRVASRISKSLLATRASTSASLSEAKPRHPKLAQDFA